jgi:hypothetical protein
MLGGGLWQLIRFGTILFLVLRVGPEDDPLFHITVLWISGSALLLCAVFTATGIRRTLEPSYLPLLRIGTLLNVATDAAAVFTGSYQTTEERTALGDEQLTRLILVVAYGILVVDLLILATLLSYRGRRTKDRSIDGHPDVGTTDLEEP